MIVAFSTAGAPALAAAPPAKDLGTMIYLLGPSASSIDARKVGSSSGAR